jgi:hypothetical protein
VGCATGGPTAAAEYVTEEVARLVALQDGEPRWRAAVLRPGEPRPKAMIATEASESATNVPQRPRGRLVGITVVLPTAVLALFGAPQPTLSLLAGHFAQCFCQSVTPPPAPGERLASIGCAKPLCCRHFRDAPGARGEVLRQHAPDPGSGPAGHHHRRSVDTAFAPSSRSICATGLHNPVSVAVVAETPSISPNLTQSRRGTQANGRLRTLNLSGPTVRRS